MPTYEYQCRSCAQRFEARQGITAPPRTRCPRCGKKVDRFAPHVETLSYGEFKTLVEKGKVSDLVIGAKFITGRLKRDGLEGLLPKARIEALTKSGTGEQQFMTVKVHDPTLVQDLRQANVNFRGEVTSTWLPTPLSWLLPMGLFFLIWRFALKKLGGGGGLGGLMAIGKSKAKVYVQKDTGVTFIDVAGIDEAKAELVEVVEFLKTPERFQRLGGKTPKGVLLVGVPGTGKTLLAKAVAGEAVEMDGFDTNNGVIIMAATNRPEILDPALLRLGRFDRQVLVDRPDLKGREAILRVHAEGVTVSPEVELATIAAMTFGFVGADLANIVNEAALLAARQGKEAVGMADFDEAIDRVVAGLKKTRVMSAKEREIVATHEAGHAVAAEFLPGADPVSKISIVSRGIAALGYTQQLPTEDRYLMTFDGGGRTGLLPGLPAPREHSEDTARLIDAEASRILVEAHVKVSALLAEKRSLLERLARRLLEKEVVERDELQALLASAHPS